MAICISALLNLTFQAVKQGKHVFRVLVAILHLGFPKSLRRRRKQVSQDLKIRVAAVCDWRTKEGGDISDVAVERGKHEQGAIASD